MKTQLFDVHPRPSLEYPSSSDTSFNHQRQPYRQFTYNDSDCYKQSAEQLWAEVYQYPSDLGFFPKSTLEEVKAVQASQLSTVPSAREAWSIYDPEKQHLDQFSVFKQCKARSPQTQQILIEEQTPRDTKKGWADLFSKPFWGSSYQKPPPFMGAFDHVQPNFGQALNVSIPLDYNPYSCYLESQKQQLKNPYQQPQQQYSNILDSKLLQSKQQTKQRQRLYYFEIESVESKQQRQIGIDDFQESRIEHKEDQMDRSAAWSYEALFGERQMFRCVDPSWQSPEQILEGALQNSQIFEVHKENNSQVLHKLQSQIHLENDISTVLPQSLLLSELSKMFQNVECELFSLDYNTLTWKLDLLAFRPQNFLRNSLKPTIQKLLETASYRSRLSCVLSFLHRSKYRKVYSELSIQIQQFLIIFEEIILSLSEQCTFCQYLQHTDKLSCQIKLLYNLMINSEYIQEQGKSYEDIDFKFLHSQALIFNRILKLARNADAIELQNNSLVFKLVQAVFKPLLVILDKILFEECQYLELNTDLYLRYYFPNPKEIVQMIGRKLALIKQQSNQLYLICKVKEQLSLLNTIESLSKYEQKWEKNFARKRKFIERIRKQYKQKLRWQRLKKKQQKMKQIYELRQKIYQNQKQQMTRKAEIQTKNRQQLLKLKKNLEERQEKRRLIEQIEKERQKNILLDLQLREKQKLAKEKQRLMETIQKDDKKGQIIEAQLQNEGKMKQESMKVESQLSIQSHQQKMNGQEAHQQEEMKESYDEKLKDKKQSPKQPFSEIIQPQIQSIQNVPSLLSQGHQVLSQNIIKSNQSIEQRFIETADAFMSITRKNNHPKSRNSSYFRIISKPQPQRIEAQENSEQSLEIQQPELSEEESLQPSEPQQIYNQKEEIRYRTIDIQTCLSICVDEIVRKQSDIIQDCLKFIIVDKYQIMGILQFLRTVLMSGNGEKLQQFIKLSISPGSLLSLRHFNKCLLFDTALQSIQILSPSFYHTKNDIRHSQINIFQDNLQYYIGFEFKSLPSILQPYFSYIHLSKYMQIFSFVVRLRHCENLISESWKLLNSYHRVLQRKKREGELVQHEVKFMNVLCMVRYKISNFLKTFQNYFFFRVIQKQYKKFRTHLSELTNLQQNHLKMLDNIIRYGFIDNPNHKISQTFKQILSEINYFYNIVNRLTLDDIPSYSWGQVQQKIKFIHRIFDQELKNIQVLLFRLN